MLPVSRLSHAWVQIITSTYNSIKADADLDNTVWHIGSIDDGYQCALLKLLHAAMHTAHEPAKSSQAAVHTHRAAAVAEPPSTVGQRCSLLALAAAERLFSSSCLRARTSCTTCTAQEATCP